MRILSQKDLYDMGDIDLPYEMCGLSMGYMGDKSKFFVFAHFQGADNKMAEYSSPQKARKAMEMLRNAYSPKIEIKETVSEEIPKPKCNDWLWTVKEPRIEVLDNFYFQFPSDDEVEV